MAFYSASFSGVNYPVNFMSTLDTWLTSSSWQFVESVGTATGSFANVYKSSSALNSVAKDFYIATYRTASVTVNVTFRLFEQWDATNKRALKYAPSVESASGFTVNPIDNTVTDATGLSLSSASLFPNSFTTYTINPQTVYGDIDINRMIVGSTNTSAGFTNYIGVYDTLLPPSIDPVPLVISSFGGNTGISAAPTVNSSLIHGGASTREPTTPTASYGNFLICTYVGSGLSNSPYVISSTNEFNTVGSLYRGSQPYTAARIMFYSLRNIPTGMNFLNNYRGVFKDVLTFNNTVARGDTIAVTDESASVRNYIVTEINSSSKPNILIRTS